MTEKPGTAIEGMLHSDGEIGVARVTSRFETGIDDVWSALTDPERLARWYGKVEGDLRLGGEFTALVHASAWDGRGRIEVCDAPRHLRLTTWEEEGAEEGVAAELVADGDDTILVIEKSGMSVEMLYAYGAGWQAHVEDLAAHLAGEEPSEWPTGSWPRWEELAPSYREMAVLPLED